MTDIPPRCPFCANVLKIAPTFWTRLGFKPPKVICSNCLRDFEGRDAHTMGQQFWNWAELFRTQLSDALQSVPILTDAAAHRALGSPFREDIRSLSSMDELVRHCLRHHRHALVEMARGRDAHLDVIPLVNDHTNKIDSIATISTNSAESGSQQHEQLIARTGMTHFILYTYTGSDGAEPRVKRALHNLSHTAAHSPPQTIGTNSQVINTFQPHAAPAHHA